MDLRLEGELTENSTVREAAGRLYAVCPDDFPGFMPKLEVKEGDEVKAGSALMHDKTYPDVKLVSPVRGRVKSVVRGERRRILRVEIEATGDASESAEMTTVHSGGEESRLMLQQSGLWAMMRQLPYAIVPKGDAEPRDIFVTAFDSAPLAPDLTASIADEDVAAGVKVLKQLTKGTVYISRRKNDKISVPAEAVEVVIKGMHPSGNASIQAANIHPINKGETAWLLDIVTLSKIGKLARTGKADWSTTVAVVGSEIKNPEIVKTYAGAEVMALLGDNVKEDNKHHRIISGSVLSGTKVDKNGFLRAPYRQLTVIPEGDDRDEFMGWASISGKKMSASASFPSHFMPWKKFAPDARLQGGRRAMIMSGLYEKVLPMDIMAEYLIKAIISRDIDKMEALGIYEVTPEDFALCEYIDPSKLELQKIVRDGLDYLRKEVE